jgi:hypothetical protein
MFRSPFFLAVVLLTTAGMAANAPPPDLDQVALQECERYCSVSYMPGNVRTQCTKFCATCKSTDPALTFKLGVDPKCDKKSLFCMQQAGASYAKTQTCEPRNVCLTKHQACIAPSAPPPTPESPLPAEDKKNATTSENLNKAAEESCFKECMLLPNSTEAKCRKHCSCKTLQFDTGVSEDCDARALTCMQSVTSKDNPPKCFERQKCFELHTMCIKQKS